MFFTDTWRPRSFYPRIAANRAAGLHTLCLLDIKVREPSLESLARGRKARQPPCGIGFRALVVDLLAYVRKVRFCSSAYCARACP